MHVLTVYMRDLTAPNKEVRELASQVTLSISNVLPQSVLHMLAIQENIQQVIFRCNCPMSGGLVKVQMYLLMHA